ncbi:YadA-like family protein [Uruburuella testudinis]|uniref:YadA-like family protein n=1 Tax=Uruburuella testudinis TaxID=1282863 RepID=A0ABY4DRU0_9NEIS|nr:YadA-like family protein [Uruburuella testudinis]UOO81751.1 YadA-like family protein [Uruburuella testudinis]
MNKVYKTVWNESSQSWVAVSELDNTKGKRNARSQTAAASAFGALLTGIKASVAALLLAFPVAGYASVAIGSTASTSGTASALAQDSIAIGTNAIAATSSLPTDNLTGNISIGANAYSSNQSVGYQQITNRDGTAAQWVTMPEHNQPKNDDSSTTNGVSPSAVSIGQNSIARAGGTAVGYNNIAGMTGNNYAAFAFGNGNEASDGYALAMGMGNKAAGPSAVAIGTGTVSSGNTAIAMGRQTTASGDYSTALGNVASATGANALAVGHSSQASGTRSIAIGSSTATDAYLDTDTAATASAADALAIGTDTTATADSATAIGKSAKSLTASSIAIGKAAQVKAGSGADQTGTSSIAIGDQAVVDNASNAIAVGSGAKTIDTPITALNLESGAMETTLYKGNNGIAVGQNAQASIDAIAIGENAYSQRVTDAATIAIGQNSKSYGGVAIGQSARTLQDSATNLASASVAIGRYATTGEYGVAIGTSAAAGAELGPLSRDEEGMPNREATVINGARYTTAVGIASSATAANASALGANAKASGSSSLAVGDTATASGVNAVAIGKNAKAVGEQSISIGFGNNVTGKNSGAIGDPTTISGEGSYSLGNDNNIAQNNTFVVGSNVTTTQANSVVLGNASADRAAAAVSSATVNGITYSGFAGQGSAENGVVSVGDAGKERQIINVAAGEISTTSTDAINGSQLYMVSNQLAEEIKNISSSGDGIHYYSVDDESVQGGNYNNDGATGKNALAAGVNAKAAGEGSVAVGSSANAVTSGSIAIGQSATAGRADMDDPQNPNNRTTVGKMNNIAIGYGATADGGRNISIGENAAKGTVDNWNIQNVNIGTEAGVNSKKDYSVAIGFEAGKLDTATQTLQAAVTDGNRAPSVYIGREAGENTASYGNIALGSGAGRGITDTRANGNVMIGNGAGAGLTSNDGRNATFPGFGSGGNTFVGSGAGRYISGDSNVAVGSIAGDAAKGDNNVYVGHLAGQESTSDRSIIMGPQSGLRTNNDRNVLIGNFANGGVTTATRNVVAVGSSVKALGYESVGIGFNANAGANNATAIGRFAQASGVSAVAISTAAVAGGENAIAMGNGAQATAANTISIGTGNVVSGEGSSAVGDPSIVSGSNSFSAGNNNAVGSSTDNSFILGGRNNLGGEAVTRDGNGVITTSGGIQNEVNASNSAIVGYNNSVQDTNVFVMGNNVTVANGMTGAVVLGNDSTADQYVQTTEATVNGIEYGGFAGSGTLTDGAIVSVGAAGAERQIKNVAAGQISAASTDAINGSQLYMVSNQLAEEIKNISGGDAVHYYSVNGNNDQDGNYNNDGATGENALAAGVNAKATGLGGIAVGSNVSAGDANYVTAIGAETTVEGRQSTAVGAYTNITREGSNALGSNINVYASQSVAVGNGVVVGVDGSALTEITAVGRRSRATGNQSTALGATSAASGTRSVAVGYGAQAAGNNSIAAGNNANATGNNAIAIGNSANATFRATAIGMESVAGTNYAIAIGDQAAANTATGDVAIGRGSVTTAVTSVNEATVNDIAYSGFAGNTPTSAFSVGAAGSERQIQNVAAGQISETSTDAINGSQLYLVTDRLGNVANSVVNVLGGDAAVDNQGNITMGGDTDGIGGTGETNIDDAIAHVNQGWNLTANGESSSNVAPGETVDLNNTDGNITLTKTADADAVTFGLANSISVGDANNGNPVTINGNTGTIGGLTNTTFDPDNFTSGQAATEDQLANVANNPLTFAGDTGTQFERKLGETVNVKGNNTGALTDGNIGVEADGTDTLIVKLAQNINLGSDGSVTTGNTVLNNNGLTITNGPSITSSGIDAGGNKITNVAAGTDGTDAVNVDQLNDAIKNAGGGSTVVEAGNNTTVESNTEGTVTTYTVNAEKSTVSAGSDSLTVTPTTNEETGVTDYAVDLADNITIGDNENAGTIVVKGEDGKDGVSLNGADGTIGLTGPAGADGTSAQATIGVKNGAPGLDGNDGENGESKTRIVYTKPDGSEEEVATLNDGLNFAGNQGDTIAKKLNDTLTVRGALANNAEASAANLRVDSEGGELVVKMAKDLTDLNSATFGNEDGTQTVVNNSGVTITPTAESGKAPVSLTENGLNNGGNKITNVAEGTEGTDAVNLDQLNKAIIDAGGGSTVVEAGNNTTVTSNTEGTVTTYTVNAEKSTVSAGSDSLTVTPTTNEETGVTDYAVDLADNITIGDNENAGTIVVKGEDGKDGVSLNGADGTIGLTGPAGADGTSAQATIGVKNGAPGLDGNDGENGESKTRIVYTKPDGSEEEVATLNDGLNFAGNQGDTIAKKLNDTLTVRGDLDNDAEASAANLRVDSEGGELVVKMAKDLTDLNSATFGNEDGTQTVVNNSGVTITPTAESGKAPVSLTENGLANGGNKITGVANGDISADSTDAVNGSQLYAVQQQVGKHSSVAAGQNITVTEGTNANGGVEYTVATAKEVTFDKTTVGNVVTDAATNTISGLANGEVSSTSTQAVNGSQLYTTNQNVASNTAAINKGLNFSADSGDVVNRQLGDTVAVTGDANIKTATTANGVQVTLNKDLAVDSVKAGNTTVNNSGVAIANSDPAKTVSVTENGLNNGGNTITNVGAGVNGTDAVNVNQLNGLANNINNRIEGVENNANAGTAAAMAVAGLPQAYLPGKSMVAIAGGVYRGESGYALGFSSISDGGNWVIKGTASGNSRGHYGATAGVGYQW